MKNLKVEQAISRAYFIYRDKESRTTFTEALGEILEAFEATPHSGTALEAFMASKPSQRARLTWATHFERAGL